MRFNTDIDRIFIIALSIIIVCMIMVVKLFARRPVKTIMQVTDTSNDSRKNIFSSKVPERLPQLPQISNIPFFKKN